MSEVAFIAVACYVVGNFIKAVFTVIIDFILLSLTYMPTDPLSGILDISNEVFVKYLPYINWVVPLDFAVSLFGAFIDAYAIYIIYKYVKRVLSAVLENYKSGAKLLAALVKF